MRAQYIPGIAWRVKLYTMYYVPLVGLDLNCQAITGVHCTAAADAAVRTRQCMNAHDETRIPPRGGRACRRAMAPRLTLCLHMAAAVAFERF